MVNKENTFYTFLFSIIAVVLIIVYADKIWDTIDNRIIPLFSHQEDDYVATAGTGSIDASIKAIHIQWGKGNVYIAYAPQHRITWRETFTQGGPLQYNVLYYMLSTHTLSIHYTTQEYYDMGKEPDLEISKDLQLLLPEGMKLDELIVHTTSGQVFCTVDATTKILQ